MDVNGLREVTDAVAEAPAEFLGALDVLIETLGSVVSEHPRIIAEQLAHGFLTPTSSSFRPHQGSQKRHLPIGRPASLIP
jgi:hypothetical protein